MMVAGHCSLLIGCLLMASAVAFAPSNPRRLSQTVSSQSQLRAAPDDVDFMASLRTRMDEVGDRYTKLPLVVLDSMLPRQVLKISVSNPVFMELIRTRLVEENPCFGMLGMARLQTGEQVHLRSGVEVQIVGKPKVLDDGIKLQLQATRRFRIDGDVENAKEGWTEGRVRFLDSVEEEAKEEETDGIMLARAMSKARKLEPLVDQWIELARESERQPGQIDQLLLDLGDIPDDDEPSERAFWVGALINPIPAMGVALEIRPALLTAQTADQRADIALRGIQNSIQHMNGSKKLF